MLNAISMQGQAYHQQDRLPFVDQLQNTFELFYSIGPTYRCQRVRQTQTQVADCYANALLAKVKRQHRPFGFARRVVIISRG
jgi:hypothetical protein